ncbi:protein serine/threonine phosphatase 2C [Peniophora sp. CONT]|nr:protein serine/threonine phosphatase 2C [Peniophora sp. CONT]
MLRRAWKPLTASVAVAGPGYWYYSTRQTAGVETFELPVRQQGQDGKPVKVMRTFPLLPKSVIETRLTEQATFDTHYSSPDGRTWKSTTARVASNDPIEDAHAHGLHPRLPGSTDQRMFFAVMDGHAGFHTSQLLSKILIPTVALELSQAATPGSSVYERVKLALSFAALDPSKELTPDATARAVQKAFTDLDYEIISAPLKLLVTNVDQNSLRKGLIPDLSQNPASLPVMQPAMSGSCAIMAILDPASQDLHVACTGDARAVAGYWEETANGSGRWRVEVMSEDQTGRNPNELKRIQSEHPPSEADDVVRRGRILGGLEPSRAFGDARYKWPVPVQEALNKAFLVGNNIQMRTPSQLLKTPPYVIATPVVTHRKMTLSTADGADPTKSLKSSLKFVVLATDGLWDELSSKDVVSLVGGHLSGLKGTLSHDELARRVPTTEGSMGVQGKEDRGSDKSGSWAFVDDNISSHLIRNAFGGGDESALRRKLSIPAPLSRRYRDDVTVTVVYWEDGPAKGEVTRAKL